MREPSRTNLDARRASFLSEGLDYDQARPSYPVGAIVWLLGAGAKKVLDLGCGPGKLTEQLAELGHDVIGMDPSMSMLQEMAARHLPAIRGFAEDLPLTKACIDVVTAGQAFHWFDHERAVPEMHRVLQRNGQVGLLWNLRDESVDWVRSLSAIIGSEDAMTATLGRPDDLQVDVTRKLSRGGFLEVVEHRVFEHEQELSEARLVALVRSRSYIAILTEEERDDVLASVRRLCREHPQLKGRDSFNMPYLTRAFRAQRVE